MQKGFRIGRLFGINIRIDWSWILIFLLITWNLSAVFGGFNQDWGLIQQWAIAMGASLLFFLSVLLHELAHSLVARSRGMPVRNITLFMFGGVSNIQREPSSPGREFWMAVVGPLTSIGIGLLLLLGFGSFSNLPDKISDPQNFMESLSPLSLMAFWLASVNIYLGLFNLTPGFPLDGGRILRSIFWFITDDLQRATRWASWVGQAIAWIMIFVGTAMIFGVTIPLFGTGLANGMWLILIGWFLNSAAVQSYRRIVVHDILEDVPVSQMMRRKLNPVSLDCTVSDLVHKHVLGSDDRAFPVTHNDELVGLVTIDDIRSVSSDDWDRTVVRQIMTPVKELVILSPEDDGSQALNKLMQRDVRQLPVVSDSKLLGLLRRRDILRWMQLHSGTEFS
jgi:Zn-dependent protease/CBS domain-containing protein